MPYVMSPMAFVHYSHVCTANAAHALVCQHDKTVSQCTPAEATLLALAGASKSMVAGLLPVPEAPAMGPPVGAAPHTTPSWDKPECGSLVMTSLPGTKACCAPLVDMIASCSTSQTFAIDLMSYKSPMLAAQTLILSGTTILFARSHLVPGWLEQNIITDLSRMIVAGMCRA